MLKDIREKRKMTQQELADAIGVDRSTVTKWELGVNSPSGKTLLRLGEILKCKVDAILRPSVG